METLEELLGFTTEDLAANRQGRLSATQRAAVEGWAKRASNPLIALFPGAFVIAVLVFWLVWAAPSLASFMPPAIRWLPFVVAGAAAVYVAVSHTRALRRARQAYADFLASPVIRATRGSFTYDHLSVRVGEERFSLTSPAHYAALAQLDGEPLVTAYSIEINGQPFLLSAEAY